MSRPETIANCRVGVAIDALEYIRGAAALLLCLFSPIFAHADERAAARIYDSLRASPSLEAFLRAFPKGGDLHNHLGGSLTPEQWIAMAIRRGFCVNERDLILGEALDSGCPAGTVPAATLRHGGPVYEKIVDVLSMRGNRGGAESAHDHFFQAFGHVRVRTAGVVLGDELEMAVVHAREQNLAYLELQIFPIPAPMIAKIAAALPPDAALPAWLAAIEKFADFHELIGRARQTVERAGRELVERRPADAAAVRYRYLLTANRNAPPPHLFVQLAAVAELARIEPRIAGLNLAGPEDSEVSLRDFSLQMRMLRWIRSQRPWLRVTLHAGELTPRILKAAPGTVPEALTFHVAESVLIAQAERIGHGTDLRYEKDRVELLRTMRERGVLAEISLTSEAVIQALQPDQIPFEAYRKAGVPVALCTDDEGILGSDLSHQFLRAARDYKLTYGDLKRLARNSLEYSFLPGQSLFRARDFNARVEACAAAVDGPDCRAYIGRNEKAEAEVRLERQFQEFESPAALMRWQGGK
jgi:adenosine deaminase